MEEPEGNLINITIQGEDCHCPHCLDDIDLKNVKVRRVIIEFECSGCGEGCYVETHEFVFHSRRH